MHGAALNAILEVPRTFKDNGSSEFRIFSTLAHASYHGLLQTVLALCALIPMIDLSARPSLSTGVTVAEFAASLLDSEPEEPVRRLILAAVRSAEHQQLVLLPELMYAATLQGTQKSLPPVICTLVLSYLDLKPTR